MPNIVYGDLTSQPRYITPLGDVKYDYQYPDGLNLRPGSKQHDKIRDLLLQRVQVSHEEVSKRYSSWRGIDQTLTAYMPVDEDENAVKDKDSRKPVSIVFPYSYAMMETLLAYLVGTFIQDPIFRYRGRSGKDTIGAMLLERCIAYQCQRGKASLALHTWFRDNLAYGRGYVAPAWTTKQVPRIVRSEINVDGMAFKNRQVQQVLYEGNVIRNIDPYRALPDPSVSVHAIQDGEFFGWVSSTNYVNLLAEEVNDGQLFNVRYLQHLLNRQSVYGDDSSNRMLKATGSTMTDVSRSTGVLNRVDEIYMYVHLIPEEWGISSSTLPEKWLFGLAADEVIIRAQPLGLVHNMFPAAVIASDYDGYTNATLSRLEILNGLQGVLDFLFNSHIANVRKAVNDVIVYDPYLINGKDLEVSEPGKRVRMRRPAWGRGVKDAIMQLPINDITRGNVADSSWIVQWMQRISMADDSMMGALRQGGPDRLTGAEFEGTRNGTSTRLGRLASIISAQGMYDLSYLMASHTQQLMSEDTMVNITGDWQRRLEEMYGVTGGQMKVSPYDLLVDFDIEILDASNAGSPQVMMKLFDAITKTSELSQQFDVFRVFSSIATAAGEKNVEEFRRKTQVQPMVAPDAAVIDQVKRGNLKAIPMQPPDGMPGGMM